MIRFKPLPGLTIATVIAVAILTWLGVWQLQRLTWKLNLIATIDAHMHAAPLTLDEVMALSGEEAQYRRVALTGHFDNAKESYVFAIGPGGDPAYHVLTPLVTQSGKTVMVDRGEVPNERLDPKNRTAVSGEARVVGIWRVPDPPGLFTPKPNPARHLWYARDLAGISRDRHIHLAAPVVVEADAAPNPGGWPKGGQTVVDLPNNHLSYAFTWFGLAAGLVGVYLAFHVSKGRLSLGKS